MVDQEQHEVHRNSTGANKKLNGLDKRPNGFKFVLFDDIDDVAKEWFVEGMISAGDMAVLYGAPGCGKSVLAEDIGLHAAANMRWHGRKIRHGAVIYIALERSQLVKRRAKAFGLKHDVRTLPFAIVNGIVNFRDHKTIEQMVETVREVEQATSQKIVLIIIDTVNRALCGGDENSSKDMGELIRTVAGIQTAVDATVLLLHHVPHDAGDRMRGHGSLLGAADVTIKIDKGKTFGTATVVKANDAIEGERVGFILESVELKSGPQVLSQAPIVLPFDTRPTPGASFSSIKLTPSQGRFVAILRNAIADLPADGGDSGAPDGAHAITRDNLKKHLVSEGWLEAAQSNNARAKVSNMLNALAAKHVIGLANQYVWIIP